MRKAPPSGTPGDARQRPCRRRSSSAPEPAAPPQKQRPLRARPARRARAFAARTALLANCAPGSAPPPRDSWAAAAARGGGRVTVLYLRSPGFAYRDDDGRLTGVTVELMRDFARFVERRHGVELELEFEEEADWRTFYARVRDGGNGIFGLGNVTITEQRRAELDFSPPYMTNVAVLITHASVPELPHVDSVGRVFARLQPLAYAGTLHEERLEALRAAHLPDTPLELANSNPEILDRVAERPHYFAYIDVHHYWRAREAGAPLRRHRVADQASEEFGIILPPGSDWTPVLNEYFAADGGLLAQPLYRTLLEHHLGPELARLLDAAHRGLPDHTDADGV